VAQLSSVYHLCLTIRLNYPLTGAGVDQLSRLARVALLLATLEAKAGPPFAMSFTAGTGAFGNYDLSAQTGGMPLSNTRSRDLVMGDDTSAAAPAPTSRRPSTKPTPNNETTTTLAENKKTASTKETGMPAAKVDLSNEKNASSSSETDDDEVAEARRSSMVQNLARQYTNKSHASGITGANPFSDHANDPDSPLNPNSEKFNARAWAKNVVELVSNEGHGFRTSGIAFQNLNVFGYGAGTDYQKDVANILLDVASMVRGVLGGNRKKRIDILQNFDGVVHKGEMLVVLGPPGSGCSTFLKTISGEMNGIYVEDSSYFNYQGECKPRPLPIIGQ
jgi:ATP-binding cassette, subfamily G (WHITE), member 2, PDR